MATKSYLKFTSEIRRKLPKERVISNYSKRLAYGVDASFYRLIPKIVLLIDNEEELICTVKLANDFNLAVTFRAAGTSLSGQAQSDSILIMLTNNWRCHEILDLGLKIKLGPAVIGSDANKYLQPYGRKIGPDPASIDSCKIAGIAANNSSGMCCGVAQNSYHTLASIRVILHDGSIFDNSSAKSVASFRKSHSRLLSQIQQLADSTKQNKALKELIEHKYRLKNTTGYAINSLTDFDDPIDILAHLMIGSEGTLGFISSITYHTVVEHKYRASALILFADIDITCRVVTALKSANVSAVELLDCRSLRSVSAMDGIPNFIKTIDDGVAALLIETRAANKEILTAQITQLSKLLANYEQLDSVEFTDNSEEYNKLWAIRKQTFPAVGAVRETGTTVIIEDVAFPVDRLAEGVADLQTLFEKYHYDEAIIFGHALEGNLHFVFTQNFSTESEVKRYQNFMNDVCQLVAVDYQGSLKAEHGTGRNMAPFVEMEWGAQGYQLMQQIKGLFDPENILNPGVIINPDPEAHLSSLKQMPAADPIVDKCIECGFCEPVCPSNGLSFTPRQRISSYREINRLRENKETPELLAELEKEFDYLGIDTCAATGLCAQRCPVNINTGDLIRQLRQQRNDKYQNMATFITKNFAVFERISRFMLAIVAIITKVFGQTFMAKVTSSLRNLSKGKLPLWTIHTPTKANYSAKKQHDNATVERPKVVYFPSCASRTMGPSLQASEQESLTDKTLSLLTKAGFDIISPDFTGQCCGMPLQSKGMFEHADEKGASLIEHLRQLSADGRYPILFDTSPCRAMIGENDADTHGLKIYEPAGFIETVLKDYLTFTPVDETIMLHVTCSSQKMGLNEKMIKLAQRCATNVVIPEHIHCCGFAGDKGFITPELNANALAPLKSQVPQNCQNGYSNSRTCEIGLSQHSGIDYQSIIYLVDRATTAIEV